MSQKYVQYFKVLHFCDHNKTKNDDMHIEFVSKVPHMHLL
jgi:hypothetical protein